MGTVDGRPREVGQVHRHLHDAAILQLHAHGLAEAQTAAEEAHLLGDSVGDGEVGRVEVHVVSHERHTCADGHGAGRRVTLSGAEVGLPLGLLDLLGHAFELAFADGGEVLAVRCGGRLLIQEDGHAVALSHLSGHFFGEGNGLFGRRVLDRDERHHVDSAHARVLPRVLVQVDQLDGLADSLEHSVAQRLRLSNYGHDEAVMVLIIAVVQQFHIVLTAEAIHDFLDFLFVASLAKVGDALHDFVHFKWV